MLTWLGLKKNRLLVCSFARMLIIHDLQIATLQPCKPSPSIL